MRVCGGAVCSAAAAVVVMSLGSPCQSLAVCLPRVGPGQPPALLGPRAARCRGPGRGRQPPAPLLKPWGFQAPGLVCGKSLPAARTIPLRSPEPGWPMWPPALPVKAGVDPPPPREPGGPRLLPTRLAQQIEVSPSGLKPHLRVEAKTGLCSIFRSLTNPECKGLMQRVRSIISKSSCLVAVSSSEQNSNLNGSAHRCYRIRIWKNMFSGGIRAACVKINTDICLLRVQLPLQIVGQMM